MKVSRLFPFSIAIAIAMLASPSHAAFEHHVVYQRDGLFAGWPANNGAWIFENGDILVGFTLGDHELQVYRHNIGPPETRTSWLALSTDGGENWTAFSPEHFVGKYEDRPHLAVVQEPLRFTAPMFALRTVGTGYHGSDDPRGHFLHSYDGGRTWLGPHGFGDLVRHPKLEAAGMTQLTPRTDYIVLGESEAIFFLSARDPQVSSSDRLFAARTTDGGRSFFFLGWVVPAFGEDDGRRVPLFDKRDWNPHPHEVRAVMSQSLELEDGTLVSSVRRRSRHDDPDRNRNWIDLYASTDGGRTWEFRSMIGETGGRNGNPPALTTTADGRLCAVYGNRDDGTMRVTYSADQGWTWSEAHILRDDFGSEDMEFNDLGYPRVVRRPDGKLVAIYYYSTMEKLHGIFASIWDPADHR